MEFKKVLISGVAALSLMSTHAFAGNVLHSYLVDKQWDGGEVFYQIDSSIANQDGTSGYVNFLDNLETAIENWNDQGALLVRLIDISEEPYRSLPDNEKPPYVLIKHAPSEHDGCRWDPPINDQGIKSLNYGNGRFSVIHLGDSDCNSVSTMMHEIGHSLGLMHEHQRFDRNRHITIRDDLTSNENYEITDVTTQGLTPIGPFDYRSIMMYNRSVNSANVPNITRNDGSTSFGKTDHLSSGDLDALQLLYGGTVDLATDDDQCIQITGQSYGPNNSKTLPIYHPGDLSSPFAWNDPDPNTGESDRGNLNAKIKTELAPCDSQNLSQEWIHGRNGLLINKSGLCLTPYRYSSGSIGYTPYARICQEDAQFEWDSIDHHRGAVRYRATNSNACLTERWGNTRTVTCYSDPDYRGDQRWYRTIRNLW